MRLLIWHSTYSVKSSCTSSCRRFHWNSLCFKINGIASNRSCRNMLTLHIYRWDIVNDYWILWKDLHLIKCFLLSHFSCYKCPHNICIECPTLFLIRMFIWLGAPNMLKFLKDWVSLGLSCGCSCYLRLEFCFLMHCRNFCCRWLTYSVDRLVNQTHLFAIL